MTDLRIAAAEGMEVSPLDAIIKAYRYNDYRRYPSVSGKAGVKYLRGVTMEMLARDGAEGWFAYLGDVPVRCATVSPETFALLQAKCLEATLSPLNYLQKLTQYISYLSVLTCLFHLYMP